MATHSPAALLDPLSDPVEWPRLAASRSRLGLIIARTALLGIASALLAGVALGSWSVALLYAAMILTAGGIGYAVALGRARGAAQAQDWTMVRAALDTRDEALAITDMEGTLLCANAAYGEQLDGYRSPVEIGGAANAALLRRVAATATADWSAETILTGTLRSPRAVSARLPDTGNGRLLWRIRPSAGETMRQRIVDFLRGPLGGLIGDAGLLAVLTDRGGAILAANAAFQLASGKASANLAEVAELAEGRTRGLWMPDGGFRPMRIVELPFHTDDGQVEAYLFVLIDEVTVVAPSDRPDNVPALLGALPLGLGLADRDGRLKFMNAAFQAAAGLADSDAALYPSDLVVDDDKALVADTVHRAIAGRIKPKDLRVRLKARPDDQIILTIARASELGDAAVILSLRDNREQLKLERQITQASKMQAVGQLAGGVAHDFNNILTAVIGLCDLMLTRHVPGDADFDDINQVRQNANRAANLVRQLLAFSRQQTLRPQVLQVSDVVGELSHLLKRLLGETITLSVRHGRNLEPVRVDPGQLEQVIVNLAVNARDAMPNGGALEISTYAVAASEVRSTGYEMMPAANYVAIDVADTGSGIPQDIVAHIFEPFFTTKDVGKGTGLGLSTVYGIVKQTGGFIFATKTGPGGTTFTIYLPAYARVPEPAAPAAEAKGEDLWGTGTILVVEDEGMVRAVAERALTRRGYEVLTAASGEEALEILDGRAEPIDLLLSDVVMPTMDGPALGRAARERVPDLRIIFMSGYAEEQLRNSIDLPGTAFLPKPFSVQDLNDAVRTALAREPGG